MQVKQTSVKRFYRGFLRRSVCAALLPMLMASVPQSALAGSANIDRNRQAQHSTEMLTDDNAESPRIQLAIILDTSNSMDGLIDQTRNQLWQVVNEFSMATQNGLVPILEIALFEFGNDSNPASAGYLRMLNSFTRELDAVSQGLFSLTTNGGDEYCGYAIESVVNELQWSRASSDIKTIFIAGNESFAQGPVDYRDAIKLAAQQGISINTIHAGGHQDGIADGWRSGALLAGGDYISIDANQKIVHIDAPQDAKIAELNAKLNQTYVPYGNKGADNAQRQMEQDALSSNISGGLLAKRAKSKSSEFYNNANWDLVDALSEGEVEAEELVQFDDEALPEPMKGLSAQQKLDYVQERSQARKMIQRQISELSESRAAYVAEKKSEQAVAAPSMSDALTRAIKKQALQKKFLFEN
ncbi:MAG: VWA domain-containing protein [Gammaproteobacteria bacterium]|nr:VWA domain-containing protein [Gammaproteobacteria bacterium]